MEEEEEVGGSLWGLPFCSSVFTGSLADSLRSPKVCGGTGVWLALGCWIC